MKIYFEAAKYDRRIWAVYDISARVFYFVGKGRKWCERKAKELNEFMNK